MDDDSIIKSSQKSFSLKRRILKEKQDNVPNNDSLLKDLFPRDEEQEVDSAFIDSIIKSHQKSFRLKRRILKEKLGNNDTLLKELLAPTDSDDGKQDNSLFILSQKESSSTNKGNSYSNRIKNLPHASQENINISDLGVDDSIADTPSRNKKTIITRRAIPNLNILTESQKITTPKSVTTSIKDFEDNLSFHPNVESTRLLNLTTPRRVSTSQLRPPLNLSSKSLYNIKLRTQQVIEDGTQMSFHKEKEEDPNLSVQTIYNQKLMNNQVREGGMQTSPLPRDDLIILPQMAEIQYDREDDVVELPEMMEDSPYSDSSPRSGFIPCLCQTQAEKVIVPISEGDFNLKDVNNSFTTNNNNNTINRGESHSQELMERDVHQNEGTDLNVWRHSNAGIYGPNTSIDNWSSHENNTNVPVAPFSGFIRPFFDSSESESEDAESVVNNNNLHSGEENNHNTIQSKTLTRLKPFTFRERYGFERNMSSDTLQQVVEGGPSKRKNHRKSIFVKNNRVGKNKKMSESIVSFKEGFEYFSRFCPFELTKKAKEAFFKICEELISDILNRVSDEAFYDGGRTKVYLRDVKNVMIQYKCFPPSPKDARYPNQHLYAFLIKHCDTQAAKLLIPPSSFERKKKTSFVDIWDDVDEEMHTTHRKRVLSREK
uniref:Uncharacterized protein n=1 Tax=Lepeophtheirus salmonis TaxID=72036 RepID=A0A0K2TBL1_LEPSM